MPRKMPQMDERSIWTQLMEREHQLPAEALKKIKDIRDDESKTHSRRLEWIEARYNLPRGAFSFSEDFLSRYSSLEPSWGFGNLSKHIFDDKYSRILPDGSGKEKWWQTIQRVVEGSMNGVRTHIQLHEEESIEFFADEEDERQTAEKMYDMMFHMKFLPPGRGLFAMGTPIPNEKGLHEAFNNCAFISTEGDLAQAAATLMNLAMLGVGPGFDTVNVQKIYRAKENSSAKPLVISDSREGWVRSVRVLVLSYTIEGMEKPIFDYSAIRREGQPIKGFSGIASGPKYLESLHQDISRLFTERLNRNGECRVDSRLVMDIMNLIGKCVVSGNIRRTAEIGFGEVEDEDFLDFKNYSKHPERAPFMHVSNNSVRFKKTPTFEQLERITNRCVESYGDPGMFFLHTAREKGRTLSENHPLYTEYDAAKKNADHRATGGNPCLEQTLESYELCCLVESFPRRSVIEGDPKASFEQWLDVCKMAFLYGKIVTLHDIPQEPIRETMARNRRIGVSQSGVVQALGVLGKEEYTRWCQAGYIAIQETDADISKRLKVPRSIKTTSIKPSGTVSLLAGASPGAHYPIMGTYQRHIMVADKEKLKKLRSEGHYIVCMEETLTNGDKSYSCCVRFLVDFYGDNTEKCMRDVLGDPLTEQNTTWMEKLDLVCFLQEMWADNQVSATITVPRPETPSLPELPRLKLATDKEMRLAYAKQYEKEYTKTIQEYIMRLENYNHSTGELSKAISQRLQECDGSLKGIAFLFNTPGKGAYHNTPYVAITKEQYHKEMQEMKQYADESFYSQEEGRVLSDAQSPMGCSSDKCDLDFLRKSASESLESKSSILDREFCESLLREGQVIQPKYGLVEQSSHH